MNKVWRVALLAALVGSPAWAKTPSKKMTEAELVEILKTDTNRSNKEKAADYLGELRFNGAVPALREACNPREHQFVCEHALHALEELRIPEAKWAVEQILLDETMTQYLRKMAMRHLGRMDRQRMGVVAPVILAKYRSLEDEFAVPLLKALVEGGNTAAADMTILIATDVGAQRRTRLEALDAAEAFKHPRIFEAYLSMIEDSDAKVRLRCAKELGIGGYPAGMVLPPLMKVAQYDEAADVRMAAYKSLRRYAGPTLVPMLNVTVTTERSLPALIAALDLFQMLADTTSLGVINNMLRGAWADDYKVRLIHAVIRIGDPTIIPALEWVVANTENEALRTEANTAIRLLGGTPAERQVAAAAWVVPDIVYVDINAPVPVMPSMSMTIDANGFITTSSGASIVIDGNSASISVTVP